MVTPLRQQGGTGGVAGQRFRGALIVGRRWVPSNRFMREVVWLAGLPMQAALLCAGG